MEFQVRVTVDLGDKTLGMFNALIGNNPSSGAGVEVVTVEEQALPETTPALGYQRPRREKTVTKVEKAETKTEPEAIPEKVPAPTLLSEPETTIEVDYSAAKLDAIKAEVTKHAKKGKSADIKQMLAHFGAGRASELTPEVYDEFYAAIQRYGEGVPVADLFLALD